MWALIKQERVVMYCGNTAFVYHNNFIKYMKVDGTTSEDAFDYLFDIRVEKFLSEKGKKYLQELFKKRDPEYLQLDDYFDDIWILMNWKTLLEIKAYKISICVTSHVSIRCSEKFLYHYCIIFSSVMSRE